MKENSERKKEKSSEEKELSPASARANEEKKAGEHPAAFNLKPRRLDPSEIKRRRIAESHEAKAEDARDASVPGSGDKDEAGGKAKEEKSEAVREPILSEELSAFFAEAEAEAEAGLLTTEEAEEKAESAKSSESPEAPESAEGPESEEASETGEGGEADQEEEPKSEKAEKREKSAASEEAAASSQKARRARRKKAARPSKVQSFSDSDDPGPRPLLIPFLRKTQKKLRSKRSAGRKKKAGKKPGPAFIKVFRRSLAREFKPEAMPAASDSLERRRQHMFRLWRQRGAAGTLLLLHGLITILLMIVWAVLPRHVFGIDKLAADGAMFSTLLIQGLAVLLPSAFVLILYNMDVSQVLGGSRQSPVVYALSALIGIPAAVAFTGLNNISLFIAKSLGMSPASDSILALTANPSVFSYLMMILITALVPALSEELMFRGIIQSSLALSGRKNLSIFLMATAFALYHNDPYFLIAPFFAGLYLGYLREKSDSLYPGILMHFVMNSSLVLLQPVLPIFTSSMAFAGTAGKTALYASLIAAAVSLVLMIPLSSTLYSYCAHNVQKKRPKRKRLRQEQWFPADWKYLLGLFVLFITMLVLRAA